MVLKSVYLDYSSREFYVSEEGYEAICELIKQHQLCGKCRQPIDEGDHLLVGKNLGLSCLLRKQPELTFIGLVATDTDGDITYAFTDADHVVYTIQANHGDEAKKDIYSSVQRAGFPIPDTYIPFKGDKDKPVQLNRHDWSVYGKLAQSVIVLDYHEYYGDRIRATFLSYKEGEVVELNKRNSTHKQLFERARLVVESTKKGNYYNLNGYEFSTITDATIYPIIAQMESAVYDVQRAFKSGDNH